LLVMGFSRLFISCTLLFSGHWLHPLIAPMLLVFPVWFCNSSSLHPPWSFLLPSVPVIHAKILHWHALFSPLISSFNMQSTRPIKGPIEAPFLLLPLAFSDSLCRQWSLFT
jgi:hypothetical protein